MGSSSSRRHLRFSGVSGSTSVNLHVMLPILAFFWDSISFSWDSMSFLMLFLMFLSPSASRNLPHARTLHGATLESLFASSADYSVVVLG